MYHYVKGSDSKKWELLDADRKVVAVWDQTDVVFAGIQRLAAGLKIGEMADLPEIFSAKKIRRI